MRLTISKTNITLFLVALLLIDQVVKFAVKLNMRIGESIRVAGDWFQIRFIENPGAAYGFEFGGEYGKFALTMLRVVAIAVLIYYIGRLIRNKAPKGVVIGFALILAGAAGNLIDSLFYGMIFSESTYLQVAQLFPAGGGYGTFFHGAVVDMLYFPIINTTYPTWMPFVGGEEFIFFSPIFNLADAYISVGFIYLLLFKRKYFK